VRVVETLTMHSISMHSTTFFLSTLEKIGGSDMEMEETWTLCGGKIVQINTSPSLTLLNKSEEYRYSN